MVSDVRTLRERALESGRAVFSYDQLATLAGIPRDHTRVYASRLVQRGLATKVVGGVVTFDEDPFLVATQFLEPSYVSLSSALYLRGIAWQIPSVVECVTTRNSMELRSPRVRYHRIVPRLFFGYERVSRFGSYVFVATAEKAVLDEAYYGMSPSTSGLELDYGRLRSMAEPYGKSGGQRGRRVANWVKARAL